MPNETLSAADELRRAIHELVARTTSVELDAEALLAAAQQIRATTTSLDGPEMARWWEGPADASPDGLRSYRHRSVFQGPLHGFSPSLTWFDATGDGGEPGYGFTTRLSRVYEGPPNGVHGGYVAGLFDELLGAVQGLAPDGGGFTGRLTVRYRSLTPVEQELRFQGCVVSAKSRRIETRATLHAGGTLCAEAEGLFVQPRKGIRG